MLRQAQHERMEWQGLTVHPDTPASRIKGVDGRVCRDGGVWTVEFMVDGADFLRLDEPLDQLVRTEGLWKGLCFELFIKPIAGESYLEFNFAQTNRWAAYAFDAYRSGMRDLELSSPPIIRGVLGAKTDLSALALGECLVSLSAVIEETDGTKSYWALRHPPGKPDFHHPDCFALELPALA